LGNRGSRPQTDLKPPDPGGEIAATSAPRQAPPPVWSEVTPALDATHEALVSPTLGSEAIAHAVVCQQRRDPAGEPS
jgi:hypothetical protein